MSLIIRKGLIGLGAFTDSDIRKDGIVVDWSDHPLFEEPPRILPHWKFVQIAAGVYSGPVGPEHPDAYLNHSCEPNARILWRRPTIHLVALRDIAAGEEVTFDYVTLYDPPWSMACRCGVPVCRGVIRGRASYSAGP